MEKSNNARMASVSGPSQVAEKRYEWGPNGDALEKATVLGDDDPESNPTLKPEQQAAVSGMQLSLVMSSLTLATFLMLLDSSIVATVSPYGARCRWMICLLVQATPKITGEFHSLKDIGWYGTSYLLAK